jgi:hypothetical protein
MRVPAIRGLGVLPRYGGGWMHQFGHVYALQQELLNKRDADWFRAMELWHTARHEGVALNVSHFTNVLQHIVIDEGPWVAALQVLRQMRTQALRADCRAVSLALAALANDARWSEALRCFAHFANARAVVAAASPSPSTSTTTTATTDATSTTAALKPPAARPGDDGKYTGRGLRMDSLCVGAVLRACVAASQERHAAAFVQALTDDASATHRRAETNSSLLPAVDRVVLGVALAEMRVAAGVDADGDESSRAAAAPEIAVGHAASRAGLLAAPDEDAAGSLEPAMAARARRASSLTVGERATELDPDDAAARARWLALLGMVQSAPPPSI